MRRSKILRLWSVQEGNGGGWSAGTGSSAAAPLMPLTAVAFSWFGALGIERSSPTGGGAYPELTYACGLAREGVWRARHGSENARSRRDAFLGAAALGWLHERVDREKGVERGSTRLYRARLDEIGKKSRKRRDWRRWRCVLLEHVRRRRKGRWRKCPTGQWARRWGRLSVGGKKRGGEGGRMAGLGKRAAALQTWAEAERSRPWGRIPERGERFSFFSNFFSKTFFQNHF